MAKDKKEKGAGYKKPPKKTQWKKGQSGNPKGRPKAKANKDEGLSFWNIFEEEMDEPITMQTAKGPEDISYKRALIKRLKEKALKEKDSRSINKILQIYEKRENIEKVNEEDDDPITIEYRLYPDDENSNRTAADYFRDKNLEQ
jgi:hypothetical protein